jgi:hypothetical protein
VIGTGTLSSGVATLTITSLPVGTNQLTAAFGGDNYFNASTSAETSVTVRPAILTVIAANASRPYAAPNPTFTGTVSGAKNGDTFAVTGSTTATESSKVGVYPIVPAASGTHLADYAVTKVNGILVVYNTSSPLPLWLSSSSATAGGAGFTLTVTGANFTAKSMVLWNGAVRKTTYVSGTQLTAAISAADIAKERTNLVTVANPAPNPGTSAGLPFVVMSATPVAAISGGSIAVAAGSSGSHVLTLTGTDFVTGSTVEWSGTSLTTTYVSPWQISTVITASDYSSLPAKVTVKNPAGTSPGFELP